MAVQERVVAERDGLMERLSERYDIFNPGSSAVSDPSGEQQCWMAEGWPPGYPLPSNFCVTSAI